MHILTCVCVYIYMFLYILSLGIFYKLPNIKNVFNLKFFFMQSFIIIYLAHGI